MCSRPVKERGENLDLDREMVFCGCSYWSSPSEVVSVVPVTAYSTGGAPNNVDLVADVNIDHCATDEQKLVTNGFDYSVIKISPLLLFARNITLKHCLLIKILSQVIRAF